MRSTPTVEPVDAATVRPLRLQVLRPGHPAADVVFGGDDDARAVHLAVRGGGPRGAVVAVGSLLPEAPPWPGPALGGQADAGPPWRIRGMATHERLRDRGLGSLVLASLLDSAARSGGGLVWCNARVRAVSLYRRAGFEQIGAEFDIAGIGPHVAMRRDIASP